MWQAGPTNSVHEVAGLKLGHAQDEKARTGVSILVFDTPATASVSILGQAPGTRESALLDPGRTVGAVDAIVLSGGSAFGLAAGESVMVALSEAGRGFQVGDHRVPIVPAAILFDLTNGGDKPSDLTSLYRQLGGQAFTDCGQDVTIGRLGAGTGATTGGGLGGLGMASSVFTQEAPERLRGHSVAALVAVNAVGSPLIGNGPHFRAAPFEMGDEFGGHGPGAGPSYPPRMKTLAQHGQNTTIGCVATSCALSKPACHGLAIAGQDGIANAIYPAHTSLDGDLVFGASTGSDDKLEDPAALALLQACATATMARAIARGVHAAQQANDRSPSQS